MGVKNINYEAAALLVIEKANDELYWVIILR